MVERLTDLMRAEAETLDVPPPPTHAILRDGRASRRRARAGVLVLAGAAASVVAVAGASLFAPGTVPTAGDVTEGAATETASSDTQTECPAGLMEFNNSGEPLCVPSLDQADDEPWPGPGGLKEALAVDLLAASPAQKQAVEDNRVTDTEYQAGFQAYRNCLDAAGYPLQSVRRTGLLFEFALSTEAVDSGADELCYTRQYKVVDHAWQLSHADEILTAKTLETVNRCLAGIGIEAVANLDEAVQRMKDAGLSEQDCGLYPGLLEAAGN